MGELYIPEQLLRSRDRVLTGLAGGLSTYLGLGPGIGRLVFLVLFILSIFLGIWLLVLILYLIVSALIPREDDPEDLRTKGFVLSVGRLALSLVALILLGVGIAAITYSIAIMIASLGLHVTGFIAPPAMLIGFLGFIVAVLGILAGLLVLWLGSLVARRI
jgi:phage shock protein PspC (stress-responsive transcriptional regulator)